MKKFRKFTVAVLCIISAFVLGGCGKKSSDEVQRYAWPLGTSSPEDTVTQLYSQKFADEVNRLSKGKMKIEVYPNSTLGGDRELLESCSDGDIPFVVQSLIFQVPLLRLKRQELPWTIRYFTKRWKRSMKKADLSCWVMRTRDFV